MSPIARFTPSRQYSRGGLVALVLAIACAVLAWQWPVTAVAALLFFFSASVLLFLAFRPVIEIHSTHLQVGSKIVPWNSILRVDRTGWITPLGVFLELDTKSRIFILYPGDLDSSKQLLRMIRKYSKQALLDGLPHRQVWGDFVPPVEVARPLTSPKYQLLRSEDEAEVERMFQQLKSAGRIDSQSGSDDK